MLDVRVSIDGTLVQERLDGKPVLVDSGEHTFKFETKDGQVKEERVLLRAAEKARPIIASFGGSGPAGSGTPAGAGPASPEGGTREGSIVPAAILGGVGVLALGSFALFGITGKGDVDDLQTSCKPNCKEADVDSARTKLIIADVSLGVGVAALIGAAVLYFTRSHGDVKVQTGAGKPGRWIGFDARPYPGGAIAGIGARFQ